MKTLFISFIAFITLAFDAVFAAISQNDDRSHVHQCAIFQGSLTGAMKGKMGNVVFTRVFGKNVVKSKALSVRNPKTAGQTSQRTKFALIQDLMSQAKVVIRLGFAKLAVGMSAYNVGMQYNLANAIGGTTAAPAVDWDNLQLSQGDTAGVYNMAGQANAGQQITITWDNNSTSPGAAVDDEFHATAICTDADVANKVRSIIVENTRDEGEQIFTLPVEWVGKKVRVYGFFVNPSTNVCSPSSVTAALIVLA